jgi:hypothetical protein
MAPIDSTRDSSLPELRQHDGVIALVDANTTIGYCRYITRPALANERLSRNAKRQVVLRLKSRYRDGTTHIRHAPAGIHAKY